MELSAWKIEIQGSRISLRDLELPPNLHSLDQVSLRIPEGVYTTFRTFEGSKAIHLDDHFGRLERSAFLAGHPQTLTRSNVREALRSIIALSLGDQDLRLRLTLDLELNPGDLYIAAHKLLTPSANLYEIGARLVTCRLLRPLPEAKLTAFIADADRLRQELPVGVEEALLLDSQDRLLEGLSSNFFAVVDGCLWTAGEGVLAGITRHLVIERVAGLSVPLKYQSVSYANLGKLEEAFITSSSRAVMPVVRIDEAIIGAGRPGRLTKSLAAAYAALIKEQCEEI